MWSVSPLLPRQPFCNGRLASATFVMPFSKLQLCPWTTQTTAARILPIQSTSGGENFGSYWLSTKMCSYGKGLSLKEQALAKLNRLKVIQRHEAPLAGRSKAYGRWNDRRRGHKAIKVTVDFTTCFGKKERLVRLLTQVKVVLHSRNTSKWNW